MLHILVMGASPDERLSRQAEVLGVELECVPLDNAPEGAWVDRMQLAMRRHLGVVLYPPEALLESVALRDAIEAVPLPALLVWDGHAAPALSLLGAVCRGVIAGFGASGLPVALDALLEMIVEEGRA